MGSPDAHRRTDADLGAARAGGAGGCRPGRGHICGDPPGRLPPVARDRAPQPSPGGIRPPGQALRPGAARAVPLRLRPAPRAGSAASTSSPRTPDWSWCWASSGGGGNAATVGSSGDRRTSGTTSARGMPWEHGGSRFSRTGGGSPSWSPTSGCGPPTPRPAAGSGCTGPRSAPSSPRWAGQCCAWSTRRRGGNRRRAVPRGLLLHWARQPPLSRRRPASRGRAARGLAGAVLHGAHRRGSGTGLALGRRPPAVRPARRHHPWTVGGLDLPGRARRRDRAHRARPPRWHPRGSTPPRCSPSRRPPSTPSRVAASSSVWGRLERARVPSLRPPVRPPGLPLRGGLHDHPHAAARGARRLPRHVLRRRGLRPRPDAGPSRRAAAHARLHR